VYVRTKRQERTSGSPPQRKSSPGVQFYQNALIVDPSNSKSKLTLQLSYLRLINYLGHYTNEATSLFTI
jgi:hypothetical protein